MQAGYGTKPTVLMTKQKKSFWSDTLSLDDIFDCQADQDAVIRLQQWIVVQKLRYNLRDCTRFELKTVWDEGRTDLQLKGTRDETDEEFERCKKNALELLADKEAKQQLEFKRLSLIYGKEHT